MNNKNSKIRNTLAHYVGRNVLITGTYKEDYHSGNPKDKTTQDTVQRTQVEIMVAETVNPAFITGSTPMIAAIDHGSIITDVHGVGAFEDIQENHIIIQYNIHATNKICPGTNVRIYGLVGMYKAGKHKNPNNDETPIYDYCISEVENIEAI